MPSEGLLKKILTFALRNGSISLVLSKLIYKKVVITSIFIIIVIYADFYYLFKIFRQFDHGIAIVRAIHHIALAF
jgi:hypothetical protein